MTILNQGVLIKLDLSKTLQVVSCTFHISKQLLFNLDNIKKQTKSQNLNKQVWSNTKNVVASPIDYSLKDSSNMLVQEPIQIDKLNN